MPDEDARRAAPHLGAETAIRATSQILGKVPKRFCRQDNTEDITGRLAKIRLRAKEAG
jgi:hypothetical protein